MNVEEVIAQAHELIGNSVEIEGELIILQDRDHFVTYIYSPDGNEADEPHQIAVNYPLATLKTIMRPLPFMQLIDRGTLINAPYFWRFPIVMTAQLDRDEENQVLINKIFSLHFNAPYGSKFLNLVSNTHYSYRAEIDYEYDASELKEHQACAVVKSQRVLRFVDNIAETIILQAEDNRHAGNLLNKRVTIPGWLRYVRDKDGNNHFLLRTFAVRSSWLTFGASKNLTSIWWKPSKLYQVVRANMPIKHDANLNLQVSVTGTIDYLKQPAPEIIGGTSPKLVFTEIDEIVIYEFNYLH